MFDCPQWLNVFENATTFLHTLLPKEKAREFEANVAAAVFSSEEVLEELRKTRWYTRHEKEIDKLRGVAPDYKQTLPFKKLVAKLRSSKSTRVKDIREAAELAFSNKLFRESYEEIVQDELHKLCEETVVARLERQKEHNKSPYLQGEFWKKFIKVPTPLGFKIENNHGSKNFKELLKSRGHRTSTVQVSFRRPE